MSNKRKIATALKYNKLEDEVPKLVAKGMGKIAENIIEKAGEYDIPTYEDERLSQQLYNLSLGDDIPEELYQVVAEVLIFIAGMDGS